MTSWSMAVASASNTHHMDLLSNAVAHTTLLTPSRLEVISGESSVELEDEGNDYYKWRNSFS
jgi:hypothetical protein